MGFPLRHPGEASYVHSKKLIFYSNGLFHLFIIVSNKAMLLKIKARDTIGNIAKQLNIKKSGMVAISINRLWVLFFILLMATIL
jgi:hypothetical protein